MPKCPHCQTTHHEGDIETVRLARNAAGDWELEWHICPACERPVVILIAEPLNAGPEFDDGRSTFAHEMKKLREDQQRLALPPTKESVHLLLYPRSSARPPPATVVPAELADDYVEACLVFADSPKASAALSRRCLQNLLKQEAKVTKRDLADQIDEVLQSSALPSHLAHDIDAIRNVGNFAAHPMKSTNTGEIVLVEPGEAEWLLDVLAGLFDFYFVQPAAAAERRAALNQKLQDIGKPPLK